MNVSGRSEPDRIKHRGITAVAVAVGLLLAACGGGAETLAARCELHQSELGPFGPDEPLGSQMDPSTAVTQSAATGFDSWIEIRTSGNWGVAWTIATDQLGGAIHTNLAWIDVGGSIAGLYTDDDRHGFEDLRVSRSFQGKIEHTDQSLFVGVDGALGSVDFEAACQVTSVRVGNQDREDLLEVLDVSNPLGS